MFKCQVLKKLSKLGEKQHKITIETRNRSYERFLYDEETRKYVPIDPSSGWEIVKEINACEQGVSAWHAMSDIDRALLLKTL
jgi:hypothetical protein